MPQFRYLSPEEYEALDLDQKVAYIEAAAKHLGAKNYALEPQPPQQQVQQPQQQPQQQQPQPQPQQPQPQPQPQPEQDAGPAAPEKGEP